MSGYFIRIGVLLLLGALLASLAALYTVTSTKQSPKITVRGKPYYSIVVIDLFKGMSKGQRNNIAGVDVAIFNRGATPLLVLTAPYTNMTVSIRPGENITLSDLSPLDSLVIRAKGGVINASVSATAHLVYRPYLGLGLLGLVLFLAGSILLSAGIIIRFSGIEEAFS